MTAHSSDWASPGAYNITSNPTVAERMLGLVETWASAARARMETRRLERAHLLFAARGSPGLSNHLRRDIGLPLSGAADVDLYR